MVRIEVLGPLRVWRDQMPVRITGRRQRLLLCVLVAEHGRTVPAGRLIDALWDGDEPTDPQNTLQQYVSHLRRALAGVPGQTGGLLTSPPGYRLSLGLGGVDLADVESLVSRARVFLDNGEPGTAADLAERALSMWRGAPFEEFGDHPVLLRVAEAAAGLQLAAVEVLTQVRRTAAGPAGVVQLIDAHPEWWTAREPLVAALVWALAAVERPADALARAERFRRVARDRGVVPGPVLVRLCNEVALYGRARTPIDPPKPSTPAERALSEFVRTLPLLGRGADPTGALAHHLTLVRALNLNMISNDSARWRREMDRHAAEVEQSLIDARTIDPVLGLDLALELARYWDWTGRLDLIRVHLKALLEAVGAKTSARRADAHAWLAFAWRNEDPQRTATHLALADAAARSPDELGRALAVRSVVQRPDDPAAALASAQRAMELLRRHGTIEEAAYAHVVAALAALAVDDRPVADRHTADAAALYAGIQHPSGLAWIDVIEARVHGRPADRAAAFARDHGDHSVDALLADLPLP